VSFEPPSISTVDLLHSLLQRLSLVVMWAVFAIFHASVILAFLFFVWLFEVSPTSIAETATAAYQRMHGPILLSIAGLLGLSVLVAIRYYILAWRKLYGRIVVPFLWRDVDRHLRR
jgi:hypothetical protein